MIFQPENEHELKKKLPISPVHVSEYFGNQKILVLDGDGDSSSIHNTNNNSALNFSNIFNQMNEENVAPSPGFSEEKMFKYN